MLKERLKLCVRKGSYWLLPITLIFLTIWQAAALPAEKFSSDADGATFTAVLPLVYKDFTGTLAPPPPLAAPTISSFTASATTITVGDATTLMWNVTGMTDSLTIDNGVGDVTGQNSVSVSPIDTTVYTLTATNDAGDTTAELTIIVEPIPLNPPVINSFEVSDADIELGDSTVLSWFVIGHDTLTIDNGVGDVANVEETAVSPQENTTYTLTATNGAGSVSATVAVSVDPNVPPKILSFTASETSISKGDTITLSFEAVNYDTLRINGVGNMADKTSVEVSPNADISYKLVAKNEFGVVRATVTIDVQSGGGGGGGGTPPGESTGGPNVVAFDWNATVTEKNRGFPYEQPPRNNKNWVEPYNYAGGVLHVRAEIKSDQPRIQNNMKLQLCFWQQKGTNRFALETCINTNRVVGKKGTVVCWSKPIHTMWKLDNKPLEWERGRHRVGVAIKNGKGDPVSNYNGWNWNGENPKHWYPFDLRFTGIVVPKGGSFDGWGKYGGGC